jgi:hypothetical protein
MAMGSGAIWSQGCLALAALGLAACTTTDPGPQQMSRTTLATAPADLQLLCANAVATSLGVDPARALPVSSRQLDTRNYQVDVDASGRMSSCIVDDDGNVRSVVPA